MPTARRIVALAVVLVSLPVLGPTLALAQDAATGTPPASSSSAALSAPTAPGSMAVSAVEKGFVDFQTPGSEPLVQRTEEQNSQLYLHLNAKFMSPYCPGLVLRDCTSSGGRTCASRSASGWPRGTAPSGSPPPWLPPMGRRCWPLLPSKGPRSWCGSPPRWRC